MIILSLQYCESCKLGTAISDVNVSLLGLSILPSILKISL